LPNSGSGGFDIAFATFIPVGDRPTQLAAGFLNNDAHIDIVSANHGPDTPLTPQGSVSILINQAEQGISGVAFAPAVTLPLEGTSAGMAKSVIITDLDQDADPDIALLITSTDSAIAQVLRNDTQEAAGSPLELGQTAPVGVDAGAVAIISGNLDTTNGADLITINSVVAGGVASATAGMSNSLTPLINITMLTSDLNGDGIVNGFDLGILLSHWSIPPSAPGCAGAIPCPADLNLDGVVNGFDLGILLSNWTIF
jgi:hypothetical protein